MICCLSYSSGTLDEASSLLVATHLALCPHCRSRNALADSLGGYLLDSLEATPVSPDMIDSVLARVRNDESAAARRRRPARLPTRSIPDPLRSYLGRDIDELQWKRLGASRAANRGRNR